MDLRGTSSIALTALLMAVLSVLCSGQSSSATYDPAGGKTAKPQEGFLDFTLRHVNAADHDYGQCLDAGRALLLDETVRNIYFWSNLIALSLLGCMFSMMVVQHRVQVRRDWNAARIVDQYERALARSQEQLEKVTKSNDGLNRAFAGIKESVLRPASQPRDLHRVVSSIVEVGAAALHNTDVSPQDGSRKPAVEDSSGLSAATGSVPQIASFKADADIVARINSLEQQLAYAQEDNKRLRQRIIEADRRVELEQPKNRQAKSV